MTLKGFAHTNGDGLTGYVKVSEKRFIVVALQDVMRRTGIEGCPERWTSAQHLELRRGPDGERRVYQWTRYAGRADSAQARAAREGSTTPSPTSPERPSSGRARTELRCP